jgi:hypothetical protein
MAGLCCSLLSLSSSTMDFDKGFLGIAKIQTLFMNGKLKIHDKAISLEHILSKA